MPYCWMTEVFLMQKIKKWRHWHLGSIFPHSGGKAHLQLFSTARKKSNLWSLHHFPETFIEYSVSWRNETAILKSWLLQNSHILAFLPFLLYYFPMHLVQKPRRCRDSCIFGPWAGPNHNTPIHHCFLGSLLPAN